MLNKFTIIKKVDFNIENIYPMLLWVLKNSNSYYNEQLVEFFKKLTEPDNVKPYKSNQKVFERSEYRFNQFKNPEKLSHYTLDYRIIMASPFRKDWYNGTLETNQDGAKETLNDIKVIARNLGFEVGDIEIASEYGQKYYAYYKNSTKKFMEYKIHKNGNMHVKFDIEFMKALNVEVSRLLGWINKPQDIKNEFPTELVNGAEKYFKQNYNCLNLSNLPLLTTNKLNFTAADENQKITLHQEYSQVLKKIIKNIDDLNSITTDECVIKKCSEILKTQVGFIYHNCLISKEDNTTVIEFKEYNDYLWYKKQLEM